MGTTPTEPRGRERVTPGPEPAAPGPNHDRGPLLWPRPPLLRRPVVMDQFWDRLTFLHWRVDPAEVAPLLPTGTVPDTFEGSTYVGLIGFRMVGAGLGYGLPVPFFGTFGEINVRLYSVDRDCRRGVVFSSLEATRLAVVLGTNAAGVPYRYAKIAIDDDGQRIGFRSTRLAGPARGATTDFAVERGTTDMSDDPLSVFLTARWGMHTRLGGRLLFAPNLHRKWPLVDGTLVHCDDELVAAAGLPGVTLREPDSVLFSPGVRTQFGLPLIVQ